MTNVVYELLSVLYLGENGINGTKGDKGEKGDSAQSAFVSKLNVTTNCVYYIHACCMFPIDL